MKTKKNKYKPKLEGLLPLLVRIKSYRDTDGNAVGGNLHNVLDDGNIKNKDIDWCIHAAEIAGDNEGVEIGRALLGLTKSTRKAIYELFYGL